MNQQPYQTPPRWWSPRLSPFWIRFWRRSRRQRVRREHGLVDVDVQGLEYIEEARRAGHGILITPNHASHADPFVLLQAADRLGVPFYFMTAWQVFARQHRVGRQVLRQHGCFSINREGHDLRAVRHAIRVLQEGRAPLVIFPEGEVFHLNDRVTPFRLGAVTVAKLAARTGGRPVSVVPCALKFRFVDDPMPNLQQAMDRLETFLHWQTSPQMPLAKRIRRFAHTLIAIKESEYLGAMRTGPLQDRMTELTATILGRLEDRYRVTVPRQTVPERVKCLRHRVISATEWDPVAEGLSGGRKRDLDDLFFVMQLYSYPVDYLAGSPSVERLAETLDKLEEDVFRLEHAPLRGSQVAVAAFDQPLVIEPELARQQSAEQLTHFLQGRVQVLLDELNGVVASPPKTVAHEGVRDDFLPRPVATEPAGAASMAA